MRLAIVTIIATLALASPAAAETTNEVLTHQHRACTRNLHGVVLGTNIGTVGRHPKPLTIHTECLARSGAMWTLYGDYPVLGRILRN